MNFDVTVDRRSTNSVKWNKGAIESISANSEALPFWVADMDFQPEPHIKAKALELAESGVYGYPVFDEFTSIASLWLKNKHDWSVDKNDIVYTMGLLHGLGLAIDIFTKEGDKILVPSPTYRPFRELCLRSGRIMHDYELGYKTGEFYLDRDRFDKMASESKMIMFCSPHNPSGLVFSKSDLEFVLSVAKKYDIPVLSDEIHADLVHPGVEHFPMGKANESIGAKCITYMAPSKTFNVAGEHSGIAIFSDKAMQEAFVKRQRALWVTSPGFLIGELTQTAYKDGLEYNLELCEYLKGNADFIRNYLKENCSEIVLANGNASFITFLDCNAIYEKVEKKVLSNPENYKGGSGGGVLSRFFGVDAGIAMNDGTWFGEQYKAFVRINFGTKRSDVEDALNKISAAVKAL